MGRHDLSTPGVHAAVALGQLELHLVGQGDAVLHRQLVERAGDGALHARAVVAPDPDDERVVELAQLIDRIDDAPDVVVGVLREAGVHLHLAGVERLEVVGHIVPGREGFVARRQLGVGGHDAEGLLTGERLLAQTVPALVELTLVLGRPGLAHVMRRVAAAGREVGEERLLGILGADVVEPLDRLVRHGVRQVVRVGLIAVARIDADDLLVLGEDRVVLAGAATEEPVEVLESPADRPAIERTGRPLESVGGQVPLPEGRRAVPVVAQDAREGRRVARKGGGVAGIATGELAHGAEADRVAVAAGQQGRPCRRADGRDMEPVVADTALGDPRVVRGLDRAAERARVAEAGVVDQDEQHVRGALGRRGVPDEVPVGLRSGEGPVGDPVERRAPDRQMTTIDDGHDCDLLLGRLDPGPSHQGPFRRNSFRP